MRWTVGRPRKTKLGIHDDGRFRGLIGREFYVHSGGFKSVGRLCIGGDCFEVMCSSNGDDLQSPLEVTCPGGSHGLYEYIFIEQYEY